jgi:hypothetical protein
LRVIYADLSEFLGTTAEWDQVSDDILIVQIEERQGHWATLLGYDRYYVFRNKAFGQTTRVACDIATESSRVIPRCLNRRERSGKLVPSEVWLRAKAMMYATARYV